MGSIPRWCVVVGAVVVAVALVLGGCLAGPQPEPPTHQPAEDGGRGHADAGAAPGSDGGAVHDASLGDAGNAPDASPSADGGVPRPLVIPPSPRPPGGRPPQLPRQAAPIPAPPNDAGTDAGG